MSNLYSLNQAYPAALPFRVVLSDGTTRTDPDQYSQDAAVMTDIGAVLAPAQPVYDALSQRQIRNTLYDYYTILEHPL